MFEAGYATISESFQRLARQTRSASPLSSALLLEAAAELKAGAAWGEKLKRAWQFRQFKSPFEAGLLFLAALQQEALMTEGHALAPYYDEGKRPLRPGHDGLARRLRQALDAAPGRFWAELAIREFQAAGLSRSLAWVLPAKRYFAERKLPFHLVEIGAGQGLHLAADLGTNGARPLSSLVLSRTGFEPRFRELDAHERRWARSCVWADRPELWAEAEPAAAALEGLKSERKLRLVPAGPAEAPALIAQSMTAKEGEGILVFSACAPALLKAEREAYTKALAQALAPWGERAVWAEAEPEEEGFVLKVRRLSGEGRWAATELARYAPVPETYTAPVSNKR